MRDYVHDRFRKRDFDIGNKVHQSASPRKVNITI